LSGRSIQSPLDHPLRFKLIDDLARIHRNDPNCFGKAALINPGPVVDAGEHGPLELR
jgi:hypothetical protein